MNIQEANENSPRSYHPSFHSEEDSTKSSNNDRPSGNIQQIIEESDISTDVKNVIKQSREFFETVNPRCKLDNQNYNYWEEKVELGKRLLEDIKSGIRKTPATDEDIMNLTWFLTAKSVSEGEKFARGTIRIVDEEGKLSSFLHKNPPPSFYSRKSSHYKKESVKGQTKGIDFQAGELPLPEQRTILFGGLKDKGIYIKAETAGCKGIASLFKHGFNYIGHLCGIKRKNAAEKAGIKTISRRENKKEIYQTYQKAKKTFKKELKIQLGRIKNKIAKKYFEQKFAYKKIKTLKGKLSIFQMRENLKTLSETVNELRTWNQEINNADNRHYSFQNTSYETFMHIHCMDEKRQIPEGTRTGREILFHINAV